MPGNNIKYIGITGTDGKSSSSYMTYHLLKSAGYRVGILSTVYIDTGDGILDNHSKLTSLSRGDFWWYIQQAEQQHLDYMIVEVSSHALYQYRTRPLRFDVVACTNLSREHLDFHRTMEHYAQTKAELFARCLDTGLAILPSWFSYASIFEQACTTKAIKYFCKDRAGDIHAQDITQDPLLTCTLRRDHHHIAIQSKLIGVFNVDNMMIATLIADHYWCTPEQIKTGLEQYPWLPWRQELVLTTENISIMIDFALTPDALHTLYSAMQQAWYTRLIAVFGATGNRDQGKRPLMAQTACQNCDIVILTEDETYHEDGMAIIDAMVVGIPDYENYIIIQDRTQAITQAIKIAQPWDLIMVTGMANFTTRAMQSWSIPRNERKVIEDACRELGLQLKENL